METEFSSMPVTENQRGPLFGSASYLDLSDRTWAEAPASVKIAHRTAIISMAVYLGAAAYILTSIVSLDRAVQEVSLYHFILLGVTVILALVNFWLVGALKQGRRAAWVVQLILSYMSLLVIPVGTVLHLFLLLRWSRFESKAWFIAH